MRRRSHLLFFFLLPSSFEGKGVSREYRVSRKHSPILLWKTWKVYVKCGRLYILCVCISDQIKPYFYAAQPADIPNWTGLHRNCIEISVSRTNLYKRLHNLYRQSFRSKYSPSINISCEYAYLIDMHIRSRACIKINYD